MKTIQCSVILGCVVLCGFVSGKETADIPEPTHRDVAYGSDSKQTIDVWMAESDQPTPVVVYIHGGGWTSGDKKLKAGGRQAEALAGVLGKRISFISVNYRLTGKGNTLPTPVHDAARAIQFIRSKATEWNLDKNRIAAWGGSAGGCTSLWLLFHDDLGDRQSTDPVARESTRVCAAVSQNGQTSIDPVWIEQNVGIKGARHTMICNAVGEESLEAVTKNYADHKGLFAEFSPINHLDKEDPPYYGLYKGESTVPASTVGKGIHHAQMGIKMKGKSDALGHIGYLSNTPGQPFKDEIAFLEAVLLKEEEEQ